MLRNQLADKIHIAPQYIASIENSGQHPSLQMFYKLIAILNVSVDLIFFLDKETYKSIHNTVILIYIHSSPSIIIIRYFYLHLYYKLTIIEIISTIFILSGIYIKYKISCYNLSGIIFLNLDINN